MSEDQNFIVSTGKGIYDCQRVQHVTDESSRMYWSVKFEHANKRVKGSYELPENWARTMVFQFIDSIDHGMI